MKKLLFILLAAPCLCFAGVVDVYEFHMALKVPRVYDNTASTGYRKYQTQRLTGILQVEYVDETANSITVTSLENRTHKTSSGYVQYACEDNYESVYCYNLIGSNRTGKFTTSSIAFGIIALPSYALSDADEDNSLYLQLAGSGSTAKSKQAGNKYVVKIASGSVAGTIGCSCSAYGHKSPTRIAGLNGPSDTIVDTAAVFGTWKIRFLYRKQTE